MMKIKIITLLSLLAAGSQAQMNDYLSISMAGNVSAISRGLDAQIYNPANLGCTVQNPLEINLFNGGVNLTNNAFSLYDYNRYFTLQGNPDTLWSESEKQSILNLIDSKSLELTGRAGMEIPFAAYTFGQLALSIGMFGQSAVAVTKKPLDILLNGEEITPNYHLKELPLENAQSMAAVRMSASYGHSFDPAKWQVPYLSDLEYFNVGLSLHYYLGLAVVQARESVAEISRPDLNTVYIRYNNKIRSAMAEGNKAGSGRSIDLGLSARYDERWYFSLMFKNLFGNIHWSGQPEMMYMSDSDTLYFNDDRESTDHPAVDTTLSISAFDTPLPKSMTIGAAYRLLPNLTLTSDYRQGFDERFGNTTVPQIGVGVLYFPIDWVPVRGGISIGGPYKFVLGLGTGLNFSHLKFDISYGMTRAIWPGYSTGILLGANLRLTL